HVEIRRQIALAGRSLAQSNPEDGRLFVRGGDARESQIYIDGLRVFSPYSRTIGGTPSRGRYSPMLFKGVSFSTGGYSAGFGQALSGVLDMNTIDQPTDTETNISLMSLGVGLGHTMLGDRQSLSINTSYINLGGYNLIYPGRADWIKPYRGFSGEAVYRYKTQNGLFKSYWALDNGSFSLNQNDINTNQPQQIAIKNNNWYGNSTYRTTIGDQHSFYWGLSVGRNSDFFNLEDQQDIDQQLNGWHTRLGMKTIVKDHFILNYGLDWYQQTDNFLNHSNTEELIIENEVQRSISSAFVESDYFLSKDLAIKAGLRVEHHSITDEVQLSPRLTLAQRLGNQGQISLGYGQFYQEVD
ncbi:MAG: TonB-dependent receptor, partial [Bacteroidota bacterium]